MYLFLEGAIFSNFLLFFILLIFKIYMFIDFIKAINAFKRNNRLDLWALKMKSNKDKCKFLLLVVKNFRTNS